MVVVATPVTPECLNNRGFAVKSLGAYWSFMNRDETMLLTEEMKLLTNNDS